ncbi:MAG TPA: enoyl-CoA hydratase/isomerase family protein [Sphingobium sp.]
MAEEVGIERRGGIGIIRFGNSPDALIGNRGAAGIERAAAELLDDPAIRVLILTGAGPGTFIRHANVDFLVRAGDALAEEKIDAASFEASPFMQLGARLDHARKPVIAAIAGPCMGGGLEIALACTLRIVSAAVGSIGLPEVRIDIFPGGGGTQRLMRVMTPQRARRFMLLGEVVDAAAALTLGIVDEVVPNALTRALELAETLAARSPDALAAMLAMTRPRADERLAEEARAFAEVIREAPARDRMRDFVARGERLDAVP